MIFGRFLTALSFAGWIIWPMVLLLTRGGSGDVVCSNRFEVGGLDEITSQQPMHKPSLQRVVDVGYNRKASRFNHNGRKPQGNDQGHAYHDYMRAYEKLFCGMPRNLSVLNVGVLDGHSLRTYSDFFGPKAHVVGADISLGLFRSQTVGTRPNIKTYEGDQTSRQTRDELRKLTHGGKFDLIIEDGCAHTAVQNLCDLTNSGLTNRVQSLFQTVAGSLPRLLTSCRTPHCACHPGATSRVRRRRCATCGRSYARVASTWSKTSSRFHRRARWRKPSALPKTCPHGRTTPHCSSWCAHRACRPRPSWSLLHCRSRA